MFKPSLYDRIFYSLNKNGTKGKDRLYAFFRSLGFRKLIVVKARYGLLLNLNPYEYIDNLVIKEGFYESEITEELLKNLSPGDVLWDIGANIGLHSLAVKKMMPSVEVVSFEPNPLILSLLMANAKLNDLAIQICAFPLFDCTAVISLHVVDGNSGMSTLTPYQGVNFKPSVHCQTVMGNDLISEGFKIPAFIKIDTEGCEIQVLNGCSELLSNPECKGIIVEADNNILVDAEHDELSVLLRSFGFARIKKLDRTESSSHALSNFLFLK